MPLPPRVHRVGGGTGESLSCGAHLTRYPMATIQPATADAASSLAAAPPARRGRPQPRRLQHDDRLVLAQRRASRHHARAGQPARDAEELIGGAGSAPRWCSRPAGEGRVRAPPGRAGRRRRPPARPWRRQARSNATPAAASAWRTLSTAGNRDRREGGEELGVAIRREGQGERGGCRGAGTRPILSRPPRAVAVRRAAMDIFRLRTRGGRSRAPRAVAPDTSSLRHRAHPEALHHRARPEDLKSIVDVDAGHAPASPWGPGRRPRRASVGTTAHHGDDAGGGVAALGHPAVRSDTGITP